MPPKKMRRPPTSDSRRAATLSPTRTATRAIVKRGEAAHSAKEGLSEVVLIIRFLLLGAKPRVWKCERGLLHTRRTAKKREKTERRRVFSSFLRLLRLDFSHLFSNNTSTLGRGS